jgi:hypothetical protein
MKNGGSKISYNCPFRKKGRKGRYWIGKERNGKEGRKRNANERRKGKERNGIGKARKRSERKKGM